MEKILVPTDFSEEANNALDAAVQISKKCDCEIIFLNIVESLIPTSLEDVPEIAEFATKSSRVNELKKAIENHMRKIIKEKGYDDITFYYEVVVGHPFLSIYDIIADRKVDLVVMGSKGASGIREIVIGSNTERVIRHAKCPVLTVKKKANLEDLKKVVYATDLSPGQDRVADRLKNFLKPYNAKIFLLKVNTHSNWVPDKVVMEEIEDFAKRNAFDNYSSVVYNAEYLEDGIIQYADSVDADIIALATHGRTGLAHLIAGSVAEDLANHAKRPLWTFSLSHLLD